MGAIAFQRTGFVVMIPIFVSLLANVVERIVALMMNNAVALLAVIILVTKNVAVIIAVLLSVSAVVRAAAD